MALALGGMCDYAESEIRYKLNIETNRIYTIKYDNERARGIGGEASIDKIIFQTTASVNELKQLRCIQALYGFVSMGSLGTEKLDKKASLDKCVHIVNGPSSMWNNAINLYSKWFPNIDTLSKETMSFRATSIRDGKHSFSSCDVSGSVGHSAQQRFGWNVDLQKYKLVVTTFVTQFTVAAGIMLFPSIHGHHKRSNIPSEERPLLLDGYQRKSTLRPSTAYLMMLHANVQPGEIVADCMCGVGTLPLECAAMRGSGGVSSPTSSTSKFSADSSFSALSSSKCGDVFVLGGELDPSGIEQLKRNANRPNIFKSPIASIIWDAQHLPLRSNSVDVFIVDMPFGVTCKLKKKECFKIISEIGRVLSNGGRAILLYMGRKTLREAVKRTKGVLNMGEVRPVNIGGLICGLHVIWKGNVPSAVVPTDDLLHNEDSNRRKKMKL